MSQHDHIRQRTRTTRARTARRGIGLLTVLSLGLLAACGGRAPLPLTVTDLSPANGATGVAVDVVLSATFDRALDADTLDGAFSLAATTGGDVAGSAALSVNGRTATFTPAADLATATTYIASVAGSVATTDGATLGGEANWSFTTLEPAPTPLDVVCEEVAVVGTGPTLRCVFEDSAVIVEVPWQGWAVEVAAQDLEAYRDLPEQADFVPLDAWPIVDVAITRAAGGAPVVAFDPPLAITVAYDADEFHAAQPYLGEGELGLGVWDASNEAWIVAGYGVFREGFWLADPIAGGDLVLANDVVSDPPRPRYQMFGSADGGHAVTVVAASLPTLPLAWGAVPFDPDHMLKGFDGPCVVDLDVVECTSTMVGVTVRVPYQTSGVIPRVVALPWNKAETFLATDVPDYWNSGDTVAELSRRLMNFVVVDENDPTTYLTVFDPPMELEIAYLPEDTADYLDAPVLRLVYWDEQLEEIVVLGDGWKESCLDGSFIPDCSWGAAVEATPTTDGRFGSGAFFLSDGTGGGIAKFFFDRWGDRMVAFGR